MKIIYDEEVNKELELGIEKYNYLCNYPIFEIKNMLINKINSAVKRSTSENHFFKNIDCILLEKILNSIDYKYTKEYFDDIVWIISDLPFHLDNRFGFIDSNILYLVITSKGLDKKFNNDAKAIHDWLLRGINYYISSFITQNMVVGYFSHNHKFFDYDFMFKVFIQFITIEPNIEISKRWWEIQGTLFFTFAHEYIQKKNIIFTQNSIQNMIKIFNDIVNQYNLNYFNLKVKPSVGMCFNSGWITNLQVNFDDDLPPNTLQIISESIKYQYDEEIFKNIYFTEKCPQKAEQYICIQRRDKLHNKLSFEIKKFDRGKFILIISYSSNESLFKLPEIIKRVSTIDKKSITI